MTQDDCENSNSKIHVQTENFESVGPSGTVQYDLVGLHGEIDKTIWDTALTSADNALVLLQWLESKRP
jgi:hypothetical protein|tara:strand:- start:145 stop:348 length:204 start_codon:yes stop_codon:yes gene_type:complete